MRCGWCEQERGYFFSSSARHESPQERPPGGRSSVSLRIRKKINLVL